MTDPLGKIEKPEAEQFKNKRKLCLVPLIFSGEGAPLEYKEKFDLYWEQANNHIVRLELKLGKVKHVYHESITVAGEEGLNLMEKLNPSSFGIAREKCQSAAVFEATEDRELAGESMDWERILLAGFVSQKVANVVSEAYVEVMKKRYEYIARVIDETLQDNEVGVLFIREGHAVQFPQDVEVFSVSPPVLDEIHRWRRERLAAEDKKEKSPGGKESTD